MSSDIEQNEPEQHDRGRRRPLVVGAALALLVVLGIGIALITNSDEAAAPTVATTTTTTSAPPATSASTTTAPSTTTATTTTAPATTTTTMATTTPPAADPTSAIWPRPGSDQRFSDPIEAADDFLRSFAGFADPILGEFMAGDSRSGEVEARHFENGPTTVVFVRQVDSDDWSVIGAASENITVESPTALDEIDSPLVLVGEAAAFEGTVGVRLYADGRDEPLVESFVTGSGSGEPGPFEGTLEWEPPSSRGGTLLFVSESAEDGSTIEAGAIRVLFATVQPAG